MTVDEFDFRDLCRDLEASYKRLGQLRDARPRPPEVRSALRPAPGPSAPGNGVAIYTLIDCETRLREVAFDALGDVGAKLKDGDARAFRLCQLMAFHAHAITQLEWADDLMEELQGQDRKLTKAIERIEPHEEQPDRPEPRQLPAVVIQHLNNLGHTIRPATLRWWASEGHITSELRGNKSTYLLTEVVAHVNRNNEDGEHDDNA